MIFYKNLSRRTVTRTSKASKMF